MSEPYFDYEQGLWVVDGSPEKFWEWVADHAFKDSNVVPLEAEKEAGK